MRPSFFKNIWHPLIRRDALWFLLSGVILSITLWFSTYTFKAEKHFDTVTHKNKKDLMAFHHCYAFLDQNAALIWPLFAAYESDDHYHSSRISQVQSSLAHAASAHHDVHLLSCTYQAAPTPPTDRKNAQMSMTLGGHSLRSIISFLNHGLYNATPGIQMTQMTIQRSHHKPDMIQMHVVLQDHPFDIPLSLRHRIKKHFSKMTQNDRAIPSKILRYFMYQSPQNWAFKIGDITLTAQKQDHTDWTIQTINSTQLVLHNRTTHQILSWSF